MSKQALGSRPLLAIRSDKPLFVDRVKERARIASALGYGWNVLVVGERGSGKTSLVRQLWLQEPMHRDVVFVSAAGTNGDPVEVLRRVVAELDRPMASEPGDLAALLAALPPTGEPDKPVVVLDDVTGPLGHTLFGTLRDDLWEVGVQWLAVTDDVQAGVLLQPPANAFFEAVVHLGPMSPSELEELVRLRLQDREEDLPPGVMKALSVAAGNPRRALGEVRQILLTGDAGHRDRESVLAELGRPAHMLYVELLDLGPVSASDQDLQERMGWTRPRLVQVLNELERAGLVVATTAPSSGAGRPRKLYSTGGAP